MKIPKYCQGCRKFIKFPNILITITPEPECKIKIYNTD